MSKLDHMKPALRFWRFGCLKGAYLILLLSFGAIGLDAQVTTSSISGIATDEEGEPLIGATVVAVHVPSGTTYGTVTNSIGRFVFPAVRVGGPFRVEVSYIGYESQVQQNIFTSLGTTTNLRFQLASSAVMAGEVVVTAGRNDIFSSNRTGAGLTFNEQTIGQVPIIGSRTIEQVTKYTPFGNGRSFGGQDPRLNNFTIDGSVFNNAFGLGETAIAGGRTNSSAISLDAIEELQVNIAPFDVRQSGFVGSAMNAVTRSGDNEFRGSVYTFLRNNSSTFNGNKINGREITIGDFRENVYGARIGGPIIKDKLFFFANYERVDRLEPAQNWYANGSPNASEGDLISRVNYEDMVTISNFLRDNFDYETGAFENYDDESKSQKFLLRLDYNLNKKNKFTLRYTQHDSEDYVLISNSSSLGFGNRRTNANSMSFRNSGYLVQDNTRSIVGEWNSTLSNRAHNTLIVGYDKQIENRGYAGALFPTVDILQGNQNYITIGFDPFTPDNNLDYSTFHITNNFNYYIGKHTITAGVNYENYVSNNLFFPGSHGVYVYNSLDDFYAAANDYLANPDNPVSPVTNNRFQFRYSALEGAAKPWQVLKTHRVDAYIQDNVQVTDHLNLMGGLRLAGISFENTALENPVITGQNYISLTEQPGYKINTGDMPGQQLLFEPRLGFNWDMTGDKRSQLRGGTGVFTGRPPLVWISNQIGNNGVLTGFIDSRNNSDYPFRPDASVFIPETPTLPSTFDIAYTDPNFRFAQVWKTSLGWDQKLPYGLVFTAEVLYNRNVNAAQYFNANLEPAEAVFAGPDNRPRFPGSGAQNINNAIRINDNVANAIVLTNTNQGHYFGSTVKLQYQGQTGFNGMLAYTYSRAQDLMSAGSIAAGSWQGARSVYGNNRLGLAFADNDIPQRIVGLLGYQFRYGGEFGGATGISLGYVGDQSGRVSFTYAGDMNGDNVFGNDLIYVPVDGSQMTFEQFSVTYRDRNGDNQTRVFTPQQQAAAFDAFIEQDDYLRTRRGMYAERNGRVFPWLHRMDLSITQDIYLKVNGKRHALQIRGDILNFGNMLNDAWGVGNVLVNTSPLAFRSVNGEGVPVFRMNTQTVDGEPVMLRNTFLPSTSPANVWTAQIGLRYSFN